MVQRYEKIISPTSLSWYYFQFISIVKSDVNSRWESRWGWYRRDDGRDDGGDENGKILLFKGLGAIRWERWTDFANTPSLSVNNASLISNNPALFALNPILFCARCSLTGNYLFPPWEQNIPSLGIKHSHRGNIVRTIKSSSFSCLSYLQQIVIEYLLGFGLLSLHIFKRQRPNMNRHFAKL